MSISEDGTFQMKSDPFTQLELFDFEVGQEVTLLESIYEHPGETPGGYCGIRSDTVIIRRITDTSKFPTVYPYHVSHPDRTDGLTFCVGKNEIA